MTKIAYNACFGGFSLSDKAVLLARKLSDDPKWGGCTLPGEMFSDGSGPCESHMKDSNHLDYKHPRTDAILIQVIEQLGKEANGSCANLAIAEVPEGGKYRIDEYDGSESVETPDSYEWQTA
jgi:hypothetical protein